MTGVLGVAALMLLLLGLNAVLAQVVAQRQPDRVFQLAVGNSTESTTSTSSASRDIIGSSLSPS